MSDVETPVVTPVETNELLKAVLALHGDITARTKADRTAVSVPPALWHAVAEKLRHDAQFSCDMLIDHTAIDWPAENKIELVYQLYSTAKKHYLMVSVYLPRTEAVAPSVSTIWPIAEFQEREVFDLFGVRYQGHPDLRRLFLDDDWKGHPLLKDYQDDFMVARPW